METTIQGKNECESTVKKIIHKPGIESRGDGKSKTVDKTRTLPARVLNGSVEILEAGQKIITAKENRGAAGANENIFASERALENKECKTCGKTLPA